MGWPEITRDTPIEEIHRIHRAIWQYTLEHGYKPCTPYINNCALCESCRQIDREAFCYNCRAIWGSKDNHCCSHGSPYNEWGPKGCSPLTDEQWEKLTKQIRDIPFQYELERKSADELA